MKWWQKKVKGWVVPFWYTNTPLMSKRAVKIGFGKLTSLVKNKGKRIMSDKKINKP